MEIFEVTESHANANIDSTEFSNKIKEVIEGMLGVVISSGDNDINHDFDDLKVIMEHGGVAFVGSGEAYGKDSATEALKLAIKDSSLEFSLIDKVAGSLIHFVIHPDFSIMNIMEAMELINENANHESDIIWGTTTDKTLDENYVKVTILFAGFDKNIIANNMDYKKVNF